MISSQSSISSPCVKQCALVQGICTGCSRTIDQIVKWSKMTEAERISIMQAISSPEQKAA